MSRSWRGGAVLPPARQDQAHRGTVQRLRPSLPSPWLSAHDAFGRTYGLQQILWLGFLGLFFFFFFTFGLGLLLAQASLIILPGEAGAAVRASASLDAKNCLFHALARTYAHLRAFFH